MKMFYRIECSSIVDSLIVHQISDDMESAWQDFYQRYDFDFDYVNEKTIVIIAFKDIFAPRREIAEIFKRYGLTIDKFDASSS